MAQIANLVTPEIKRSQSAAKVLRRIAEEADSGEVETVVIIAFRRGGDFKIEQSEIVQISEKIGLLFRAAVSMGDA